MVHRKKLIQPLKLACNVLHSSPSLLLFHEEQLFVASRKEITEHVTKGLDNIHADFYRDLLRNVGYP